MIIDFHTHIFPDPVAKKAIPKLSDVIELTPSMNGTLDGLLFSSENADISVSVVLPPVTDPRQYESILRFALTLNEREYPEGSPRVLSFAGIHPEQSDYKRCLSQIKELGFPGIKLHPDYQNAFFDDIRYMRILDRASELDLITVTHTGYDPYSPNLVHCNVDHILHVLDDVKPQKLILAHMGNNEYYDEVEQKLVGRDVYFDTAYSIANMNSDQFVRIIRNHGADKILFASDAPWSSQKEDVSILQSTALSSTEKEQIFYKNAAALLHL